MMIKPEQCQFVDARASSQKYPQALYLMRRAREHGLAGTMKRILAKMGLKVEKSGTKAAGAKLSVSWKEGLGLQPGDLVEVRSADEIHATLDQNGRHKGLVLMPAMLNYADRRLRVYRRVERILLESTGELRRMKNTVLLEGALCDGYQGICDRSCFYFWREVWLRRLDGGNQQ